MRVNVYAEEMTDRIEIIAKEIDGHRFTGLRFCLELPTHRSDEGPAIDAPPVTVAGPAQVSGPFLHRPGDDDSATVTSVTFWGKRDLRDVLKKAMSELDKHYDGRAALDDTDGLEGPRVVLRKYEGELKVFTWDHEEYICARDALDAATIYVEEVGADVAAEADWEMCDPAKVIKWNFDDGGDYVEVTFAELAKRQGRGYLGGANY